MKHKMKHIAGQLIALQLLCDLQKLQENKLEAHNNVGAN
jgi:hypothetical protein